MSTMSNEIKLLSGNSHPILARLVADRSVPLVFPLFPLDPTHALDLGRIRVAGVVMSRLTTGLGETGWA